MKKFLVMAIVALSMVFTSCGISGGGIDNAPKCDDEAGTINGVAYDNETYKCWKIDWWEKEETTGEEPDYQSDTNYEWATEYEIRKQWLNWKAAANVTVSFYGVTAKSTGDFTLTELRDRDQSSCYSTYGQ